MDGAGRVQRHRVRRASTATLTSEGADTSDLSSDDYNMDLQRECQPGRTHGFSPVSSI